MTEQNKSPEATQTVRLASIPSSLKEIVYTAAKVCTSPESPGEIFEEATAEKYAFNNDCSELSWDDECCKSECQAKWYQDQNNAECNCDLTKGEDYQLETCRDWKEREEKHNLKNKTSKENQLKLIIKVIESGHHSVLEHCYFVFFLDGLSRACTHQIVRHRHMSFSQKSQRYVAEKGQFEYIIPPTVKTSELRAEYKKFMSDTADFYAKMIEAGLPAEDARYILPNAAASSMVASLNLRELIHLANLRTCMKAQKEIRDAVKKMCDLVIEKEPWLKDYLVPQCAKNKKCTEHNGCGRFKNEN